MNWEDDLAALAIHAGHVAFGDPRNIFFGEIIDWDPVSHVARAQIPVFQTVDPTTALTSDPAQTPWFPYMTLGIGCMWAPVVGDLCVVIMTERATDAGVILGIPHSDKNPPPIQLSPPLAQGEFLFVQRNSLSYLTFRQDGTILVQGKQQGSGSSKTQGPYLTVTPQGNIIIQGGPDGPTWEMVYNNELIVTGPEGAPAQTQVIQDNNGVLTIQNKTTGSVIVINADGSITITNGATNVQIALSSSGNLILTNLNNGAVISIGTNGAITLHSPVSIDMTAPTGTITANGNTLG